MHVLMCVVQAERSGRNPDRPAAAGAGVLAGLAGAEAPDADDGASRKRVTRLSSPERWEIKQVGK